MKAKKENKVYRITTEVEKQRYLKEGFDIYDDDGKIIAHSPLKKIAYSEYVKVAGENAALKAEMETLQAEISTGTDDADVIAILSAYALEHKIDLGRATSVSGIVKKIKEVGE